MATVGSHQQATFTVPINGTSPVDANEVRLNDNSMAGSYNAHDNDATLHVQTSTLALRPTAGTAGRLWFTTDERRLYYDTGTLWQDLTLDAGDIDTGTVPTARVVGAYDNITSVGTLDDLAVTGNATAGSFTGPLTGNVTGNVTGNASTATALSSARTFAVTGDVVGSVSSNLSSGASISTSYTATVPVNKGGTGLTAAPANGQVPIGNGTGYTLATITAGNNMQVVNAAGSITLNVTGLASGVSGTATGGTVPRMAGTGVSSQITTGTIQDDGTNIGVGGAPNGSFKVNVTGALNTTGAITGTNITGTGTVSGNAVSATTSLTGASLSVTGTTTTLRSVAYVWPAAQGAANTALVNNGSGTLSWASLAQPIDVQTFNSSGTWNKPSAGTMALVEVWGAGGGGGNSSTVANIAAGGGGMYMFRLLPLSDLAASVSVTVGAGGTGAGAAIAQGGGNGGNSSFGSLITSYGGAGGPITNASTVALGGRFLINAYGTYDMNNAVAITGGNLGLYLWHTTGFGDRVFNGGIGGTSGYPATTNEGILTSSVYGGAGGWAANLTGSNTSIFGGNGGASAGANGSAPGGGGARGNGTSSGIGGGAGAAGRVKVTVW